MHPRAMVMDDRHDHHLVNPKLAAHIDKLRAHLIRRTYNIARKLAGLGRGFEVARSQLCKRFLGRRNRTHVTLADAPAEESRATPESFRFLIGVGANHSQREDDLGLRSVGRYEVRAIVLDSRTSR